MIAPAGGVIAPTEAFANHGGDSAYPPPELRHDVLCLPALDQWSRKLEKTRGTGVPLPADRSPGRAGSGRYRYRARGRTRSPAASWSRLSIDVASALITGRNSCGSDKGTRIRSARCPAYRSDPPGPGSCGGLSNFPEAQVHVFKRELQPALNPRPRDRLRYRPVQFSHQPRWVQHEVQGEWWFGFDGIRVIPGLSTEVLIVPLVGHTRSHSGVAVRQGDTWLLHSGVAHGEQVAFDSLLPDMAPLLNSDDFSEGVNSFLERRTAVFHGR